MSSAQLAIVRAFVRPILEKPFENGRSWQVQGLGMLRTYIDRDTRLHIWDRRLSYCADSGWHTHPWDFKSMMVAGLLVNERFIELLRTQHIPPEDSFKPFLRQQIICGPDGCSISDPESVWLESQGLEKYYAGNVYCQRADEIHTTHTTEGAISIITRKTVYPDGRATVYYPEGSTWSSAEARVATVEEIGEGCRLALKQLTLEECQ